jgi:S-adenosylmethionine:tRNA-ribosyltransferase-isomerase (queuine synthetase)
VCAPTDSGREHLQVAYAEALEEGYLWHEFGDLHLILPRHTRGTQEVSGIRL